MLKIMSSIHAKDDSNSTSIRDTLNPSLDFSLAIKEYSGLITLVQETAPSGQLQLSHFFFPFFVYIYLFLLKENKFSEAQRFISIHYSLFLKREEYAELIQQLSKLKTLEEAEGHSYFKNFCEEHRYNVNISEDNMKLLKEYLQAAECRILSHILDRKFYIKVFKDQTSHEHTTEVSSVKKRESTSPKNESPESNSSTKSIEVEKTNNELSSRIPCYYYTISCRQDQLCCVDINRKNTLLACGFESSGIHIWNLDPSIVNESVSKKLDSNELKECLPTNSSEDNASSPRPSLSRVLNGHNGGVYGLAFAGDSLMSCSEDTTARQWRMTDFKNVNEYPAHKYPIWDVTVSADRKNFATASLDCTACLWNFNSKTPERIFAGHTSDVDLVRFHSSHRYLGTASADKTIKLWSIQEGRSVRSFPGHDTHINSIAFSPDGKHIASADDSGCIKIWDLASGRLHSEIVAHSKKILCISYSTDSSLVASCGLDRCIKIWDAKHSSLSTDEEGKSESQTKSLVDSYSVDSVPHYVRFCQKNVLISVGTQMTTEN